MVLAPPPAGGSGLSPGQRNGPEDEGGGPHRVLLSNLPAKRLTAVLGEAQPTLDPAPGTWEEMTILVDLFKK